MNTTAELITHYEGLYAYWKERSSDLKFRLDTGGLDKDQRKLFTAEKNQALERLKNASCVLANLYDVVGTPEKKANLVPTGIATQGFPLHKKHM